MLVKLPGDEQGNIDLNGPGSDGESQLCLATGIKSASCDGNYGGVWLNGAIRFENLAVQAMGNTGDNQFIRWEARTSNGSVAKSAVCLARLPMPKYGEAEVILRHFHVRCVAVHPVNHLAMQSRREESRLRNVQALRPL
jgi:hypothetical protein